MFTILKETPCPVCRERTLDVDMRVKIDTERTTMFGMFALEVKVKHRPVIFCTRGFCPFEQWGRLDGPFVVFDEPSL